MTVCLLFGIRSSSVSLSPLYTTLISSVTSLCPLEIRVISWWHCLQTPWGMTVISCMFLNPSKKMLRLFHLLRCNYCIIILQIIASDEPFSSSNRFNVFTFVIREEYGYLEFWPRYSCRTSLSIYILNSSSDRLKLIASLPAKLELFPF